MNKDKNTKQREYRKSINNKNTKVYEKTSKGFLVRTYRNMLSRVSGVTKHKNHLYLGLEILDKHDFYMWSLLNVNFQELYKNWKENGYIRTLTPSIDRIDSSIGYLKGNIRWVTFTENCKQGALSKAKRYSKDTECQY